MSEAELAQFFKQKQKSKFFLQSEVKLKQEGKGDGGIFRPHMTMELLRNRRRTIARN